MSATAMSLYRHLCYRTEHRRRCRYPDRHLQTDTSVPTLDTRTGGSSGGRWSASRSRSTASAGAQWILRRCFKKKKLARSRACFLVPRLLPCKSIGCLMSSLSHARTHALCRSPCEPDAGGRLILAASERRVSPRRAAAATLLLRCLPARAQLRVGGRGDGARAHAWL